MALMHSYFFSHQLGMQVAADVILPQSSNEGKVPVLWLLHGASDNHTIWGRRTSVERYASQYGLAVIMPNAHLSRYTNMAHGGKYLSYIADELPQLMRGFFPMLSDKREDNYIAGLSMGGYGSLKIGLSRPGNYAAIGCFSGGNFVEAGFRRGGPKIHFEQIFGLAPGESAAGTLHDVTVLADNAAKAGGPLPRIYQACGTEDFVYESHKSIRDHIRGIPGDPFKYECRERPGVHEWAFWDEEIQRFLEFTYLPKVKGVV